MVIKLIIFILRDVKYALNQYWLRARAFLKFNVFLPKGAAILCPEHITIGKDFIIGPFSQLICQDPAQGSELVIGDNVALNHHVFINADCGGKIVIEKNVMIGPMTILRAANHNFDDPSRSIRVQGHKPGTIHIEEDVWVGAGVIILPDVRIGKFSVIGAGSVVTRDIPAYSVAVGNPAKVIRQR